MKEQNTWTRPECDCCHHYCDECRRGTCIWQSNNKQVPNEKKG